MRAFLLIFLGLLEARYPAVNGYHAVLSAYFMPEGSLVPEQKLCLRMGLPDEPTFFLDDEDFTRGALALADTITGLLVARGLFPGTHNAQAEQ